MKTADSCVLVDELCTSDMSSGVYIATAIPMSLWSSGVRILPYINFTITMGKYLLDDLFAHHTVNLHAKEMINRKAITRCVRLFGVS